MALEAASPYLADGGAVRRFRMNTDVFTASPQNGTGIFFAFIMQRAMPAMV